MIHSLIEGLLQWPGHRGIARELQSVVGLLSWCAPVVYSGRLHLQQLHRCLDGARKPSHRVYLNAAARADLQWWQQQAAALNGKAIQLASEEALLPSRSLYTDACGMWDSAQPGVGGFLEGGFFSWSMEQLQQQGEPGLPPREFIQLWELLALILVARHYPDVLAGGHWTFYQDNNNVLAWVNKQAVGRGPCFQPAIAMLKELYASSIELGFRFKAVRVASEDNTLADPRSRGNSQVFMAALRQWGQQQGWKIGAGFSLYGD